jgi:hypothetical protein
MDGCYSWNPNNMPEPAGCSAAQAAAPGECPIAWWFWLTAAAIAVYGVAKRERGSR